MKRAVFPRLRMMISGKRVRIPDIDQLRDELRATDDWSVGDMAECINSDGEWYHLRTREIHAGPVTKEVLKVIGMSVYRGGTGLEFSRYPGRRYCAASFRKITPKADAIERSDSSFIELVRRRSSPADKQPPVLNPEPHREDA